MAGKAVATKAPEEEPQTALINYDELGDDFEFADDGVDNAKVRPQFPKIMLVQGTTKLEGSSKHLGEYYDEGDGSYHERISVTPLRFQDNRACFEQGKDSPVCMSTDGIKPLPGQPLWKMDTFNSRGAGLVPVPPMGQPVACADCPFSQWEGDKPPLCGEGILALVQTEEGEFRQMRFTGTALGPIRNRMTKLVFKMRRLPIYAALWTFSSREISQEGRKWMQLDVITTPHPIARVKELTAFLKGINSTVEQFQETAEEEVRAGADHIDEDVPF